MERRGDTACVPMYKGIDSRPTQRSRSHFAAGNAASPVKTRVPFRHRSATGALNVRGGDEMVSFGLRDKTHWRHAVTARIGRASSFALLVGAITLALAAPVLGQGAGASIEGVVKDQQGGVLPGVTVTLRNLDSGVTRTSTTEPDGHYRFLALAP